MKSWIGWTAIALWGLTAAVGGVFLVRGNTAPSMDGRIAIMLQTGERDFVMDEMRSLLVAVRDIADGLNRNDPADIAKAARSVGMAAAHDAAPALLLKLPLDFKRIAMPLHAGFDDLAVAAEGGEPSAALAQRLVAQLDRCIGCHAAFRIDIEAGAGQNRP